MDATAAGIELSSVEYQPDTDTHRFEYDRSVVHASVAVVAALSEVMGCDPTEMEPLHASVDTGALDGLFHGRNATDGTHSVTFPVSKYVVSLYGHGVVTVSRNGHEGPSDPRAGSVVDDE